MCDPTATQVNPIVTVQGLLADAMTLLPIAADQTASTPRFAFIQSTMGQGYGVMLDHSGGPATAPLMGPLSPNVTHPRLAFLENGQPFVEEDTSDDGGGGGGGRKRTGLIVGVVAAVVVVIGVLGFAYWRRHQVVRGPKQKQLKQQEAEYLDKEKTQPTTSGSQQQQQQHVQGTFKLEADQNHIVEPIEPTPASGVGYYSQQQQQPQPQPQQQQQSAHDQFQPQPHLRMQGFQFSSHPRPSFVKTSAPEDDSTAANTVDEPFNPIWEPKPFVPPTSSNASPSTHTTVITTGETRLQAPQDMSQGEGYGYGPGVSYANEPTKNRSSPPTKYNRTYPHMGNLDLDCVTSDASGQTLYGLAVTFNYSAPLRGSFEDTVVLVESKLTSASASHKDLTWSVISAFSTRYLPFYHGARFASVCAISSTGVFTFFTKNAVTQVTNSGKKRPCGFQYLPGETMDASFGYTGRGAWRNLTVSEGVGWESNDYTELPRLFYTGAGDTGTGAGTGLDTQYGEPQGIAQAGDELYVYGSDGRSVKLTAFSLKNTNTSDPVVLRTYNATSTSDACWSAMGGFLHTAVYKGTYYLACGVIELSAPTRKGQLHTIKDIATNITSFAPKVDILYPQLESNFFVPVSGGAAGATTFAFLQRQGVARSLILDGSQAGVIHDGINLTIAESFGEDPNPKRPSTNNNSDGDGLGAGGVVGIIALVAIIAGAILFIVKSQKKKAPVPTSTTSNAPPLGSPPNLQMQKTFGPDRPNKFRYPLHLPVASSVPTHILPMAPITPIPAPTTTMQPQTFQDQMQGLQFSSHPRPNFVTTGATTTGYGQEGSSLGPHMSATSATAWQPTPFVPPTTTRPPDTTGTGPASISVNIPSTTIATTPAIPPQVPNITQPQAPQVVEQDVGTGNEYRP
ncbi:hypothetical protein BGW39_010017 [Mortierella sp. 14UC]|nr:hypothetical protein BGW39_010017 [Mortierella sp. 14UC]